MNHTDMKSNFRRAYIDPLEFISSTWPDADTSHITYLPEMKSSERQFYRMEGCEHDGTLIFTNNMIRKCLVPLLNKTVYYKPSAEQLKGKKGNIIGINYKIGRMKHAVVFGEIGWIAPGGVCQGQRERVRIPVISEFVIGGGNDAN